MDSPERPCYPKHAPTGLCPGGCAHPQAGDPNACACPSGLTSRSARPYSHPSATPDQASVAQDGGEQQVLAFLGDAPCALDTLSARSGLTPADLLAMLLPLGLAGRVAQLPGGLYQKLH